MHVKCLVSFEFPMHQPSKNERYINALHCSLIWGESDSDESKVDLYNVHSWV